VYIFTELFEILTFLFFTFLLVSVNGLFGNVMNKLYDGTEEMLHCIFNSYIVLYPVCKHLSRV